MNKIIVILGPTSSGKSSLAVRVAKKFDGEIISADSRQVYQGLDIGTGKIKKNEMRGIRHHLLDVQDPKKSFDVAKFKKLSDKAILEIHKRGKLPIVAGGTGFYIESIVDDVSFPEVKKNLKFRGKLERIATHELFKKLLKIDPERASNIDPNNKMRIIRALEIVDSIGKVPKRVKRSKYDVLQIGIDVEDPVLKKKIKKRIDLWFQEGFVQEGTKLIKKGLSMKRFNELGLEYRLLGQYLRGEISKEKMVERMNIETYQYVKRQRTWFKRNKDISWFRPSDIDLIKREVKIFLDK